ncbi:MAG: SGNH/GDSL hydrolase family protein [Candidatus Marinimicrobia bacterium]|nr:SGNH/GDSL hydrolase family protein [Candidatus Neomarinimicrobiota bacterium]
MSQEKKHIVLAGDSIFDNGSYVPGQPDVAQQLRNQLGEDSNVTLLAIDGDVTKDVHNQLTQLPEDTSHLFISVGGNDALGQLHIFTDPVSSVGEGFLKFSRVQTTFQQEYKAMLENALSLNIPTTICTIYKPCFYHPDMSRVGSYVGNGVSNTDLQNVSVTALAAFNDVILQEAVTTGIPLMDLRVMYDNVADYANPIEPSTIGGRKMVSVMESIINDHPFSENMTVLYTN